MTSKNDDDSRVGLRRWTQARIGMGRVGHSLPTRELLDFKWAHAKARDAVHSVWDILEIEKQLQALGDRTVVISSRALTRAQYLRYPPLGRQLDPESAEKLSHLKREVELDGVVIISDGLSSEAIEQHAIPLWKVIKTEFQKQSIRLAPLVLAPYSRVALSDEVGKYLGAKLAIILIGERPGLSAVDSLGIYLTYNPQPGNLDSQRNCISNIRPPHGMSYEQASQALGFLMDHSLRKKISGVRLMESSLPEGSAAQ